MADPFRASRDALAPRVRATPAAYAAEPLSRGCHPGATWTSIRLKALAKQRLAVSQSK